MKQTKESEQIARHFTDGVTKPYDMVEWHLVDASIVAVDGEVIFDTPQLEFPKSWSQNAINIVAQKYFSKSETSLKEMVGRVVNAIKQWGIEGKYFTQEVADIFADELTYLLITQKTSFNSPVWFNIGLPERVQQSSACFILSVDDSLSSILNWISEEGIIFKGGSGAGINLSNIRGSKEKLSGGGIASGPVSFMKGADASAGAIRSGGTTRRAAKMVVLDDDHPDIFDFIWCKALEERKSRVLDSAGFNMGVDGSDKHSIQFQNANNSVRLSDAFFEAVKNDEDWNLTARNDGAVTKTVKARELLTSIAEASWECADPGVQYDSTINHWHTTPNAGRISASNPCSEYFHLDNSACNLSSLNLLTFYDADTQLFDVEGFKHAVDIMITAQDILVGFSDYPTEEVGKTAKAYRQLGLGYTNLGALIMSMAMAYDSKEARELAGSITALMTGQAYLTSTQLAFQIQPFTGYEKDKENMLQVLGYHKEALESTDSSKMFDYIFDAAQDVWDRTTQGAYENGVRNSQVTVLAPTGTISFMMDCDTTGIEPDFALYKTKQLVGGGTMTIVNQSVERALVVLGYDSDSISKIKDFVFENGSMKGSDLKPAHLDIFDCAVGETSISSYGHILMMAAVQPFISGGISKTVNLPTSTTPEEIMDLIVKGHSLGVKALAIYRDNSKVSQPLLAKSNTEEKPIRRSLPRSRSSKTFEFMMSGSKGYVTVGEYEDGTPGEIFVRVSKQGSTLAGTMDAFAISISHGLQYGVPLASFIDAFIGMRFEPTGVTDDSEIRFATSIIDYIFRRLALMYLSPEERIKLNIYTSKEKTQLTLSINGINGNGSNDNNGSASNTNDNVKNTLDMNAPICTSCGHYMVRSGSCFTCSVCGATSGCS